ncbi:MAG TPA: ABC transporter substrate-binding protein [Acidimicrobiia bacterium]|nr:ABC transporter substrate-binding protein [Acidimicrobiia bacterium]
MLVRSVRRWSATLIVVVLAAACTTSKSSSSSAPGATSSGSAALTASARGVTANTIKIGFSYIDLEALAKTGIIKIDHGPYEQIINALVDDINAHGGVNGRKLVLFTAKYSPIGNTEQLAACAKLTEDDQVFAVLNGFLGDNNLCVVQQHATALVGGTTTQLTPANLAKANAPWASTAATSERSIDALVKAMDKNGALKGHTIGVYAAQIANKPLIDAAVKALTAAGSPPAATALNDAPDNDVQAATAQDKVIVQRFTDAHVDTVIDVGQFIPGADFDNAGYHPSLYTLEAGNIAAAAFTNPLAKFPIVAGLGASGDPTAEFKNPAFVHCAAVWKEATGKVIENQLQEDLAGKSSGDVAMQIACSNLQVFVLGATAAGANLDNATFEKGIESLGRVPSIGSFGPNKLDAQDTFQLLKFDPTWKQGQGKPQLLPIGQPVVFTG